MRAVLMRWKYVVCAIVLAVAVGADARDAAPARTPDAEGRSRVAAAERATGKRVLPRIIQRIVKALSDGLIGPRP